MPETHEVTKAQLAIALRKLYTHSGPGDDTWCELDYQALEYALGHPVDRVPPQFDQEDTHA